MKKKSGRLSPAMFVVVSIFLGWPLVMQGQDVSKVRLAIVDFTTTSQEPEHAQLEKVVPEWLTAFFVKKHTFDVIERRQLEAILQEQTLGQTGLLDEQSAAQVGRVLGVDVLVTGTIMNVADTLEVTARLVGSETGTILGVANVVADDVEELREGVETLGNALIKTLTQKQASKDVKMIETFDGDWLDSTLWEIGFEDEMTSQDRTQTTWQQHDGILRLTATYTGKNDNRGTWIFPYLNEAYTSIEVSFQVKELEGEAEVCVGATWAEDDNDDAPWTGICPYFGDDYSDITVFLEDKQEHQEEIDIGVRVEQWYQLRLQYMDGQFHYYLNNTLLTTIAPDTPVNESEGFWADLGVFPPEARAVTVEFDDVILR